MTTLFSSPTTEIRAQEKNGSKQTKPSDKAKKLVAQADKLFFRKNYRLAIDKYAEAIAISPNYPAAHYWKGYAHYYLNEFDQTVEELDTAFNQKHTPLEIYKLRWYVNYQKGNYDAALNDIQAGLLLEPQNKDFAKGLGEAHFKKGSYQEAIPALENVIQSEPNNGDLFYFLAASYSKTGNDKQQAFYADEAIKKNTIYIADSYILLGDSFLNSNKKAEAIEAYKKAVNAKPEMTEKFYMDFSALYRDENRLNEAADMANKGLKIHPKSKDLLIKLTWYYSLSDRFVEAVGIGQQAARNAPDEFEAHTNLCRAYNDLKQYPQAIVECNKALKLKPTDGETFFYLGRAQASTNKVALAAESFKKAVAGLIEFTREFPLDADGHYLLGNAYVSDNQIKNAIASYNKSLELNPNFVKARLNLGSVYFSDDNMPAAREQYDALLKIDKVYAEKLKSIIEKN
ncbi:MAG: tetratricopeptide repeat protein [Acidobacteriota bacterium]|nr:tetratricopeptide repeat protein [Acidobacteriota bacterium]